MRSDNWVLALYDFSAPVQMGEAWPLLAGLAQRWSLPVGRTTYRCVGDHTVRHPRYAELSKLASTMAGSHPNIIGIEPSRRRVVGWECEYFGLSISNISNHACFAISCKKIEDGTVEMKAILIKIYRSLRPKYGFITLLDRIYDPIFYVAGIPYQDADGASQRRLLAFQSAPHRSPTIRSTKLRDVYEINIVTEGHLTLRIDTQSLRSWIGAGDRGALEEFCPGIWLWDVRGCDMPAIRARLIQAGALISPV